MAGLKEIKRRLTSVRNTKKITYAMKLVSAAKLRKAQDAVTSSRAYRNALNDLIAELLGELAGTDFVHPLLTTHEQVKNIRLIVIGGSRGLSGAYNTNVNKKVEALIKDLTAQNPQVKIDAVLLGKKPAEYFRRVRRPYQQTHETLPEDANLWPIDQVCAEIEADFAAGNIDEVYLVYTKFRSALSMTPTSQKLLPMDAGMVSSTAVMEKRTPQEGEGAAGGTLFEPSINEVFGAILPRIVRSNVRQACLDAKASEHGSRMTAMDAATKNAGELSHSLQLAYNKLRQLRITSELLDIIGGAEAIS